MESGIIPETVFIQVIFRAFIPALSRIGKKIDGIGSFGGLLIGWSIRPLAGLSEFVAGGFTWGKNV
jgi:hypothetical protein